MKNVLIKSLFVFIAFVFIAFYAWVAKTTGIAVNSLLDADYNVYLIGMTYLISLIGMAAISAYGVYKDKYAYWVCPLIINVFLGGIVTYEWTMLTLIANEYIALVMVALGLLVLAMDPYLNKNIYKELFK
jgi:hypothetical protein